MSNFHLAESKYESNQLENLYHPQIRNTIITPLRELRNEMYSVHGHFTHYSYFTSWKKTFQSTLILFASRELTSIANFTRFPSPGPVQPKGNILLTSVNGNHVSKHNCIIGGGNNGVSWQILWLLFGSLAELFRIIFFALIH